MPQLRECGLLGHDEVGLEAESRVAAKRVLAAAARVARIERDYVLRALQTQAQDLVGNDGNILQQSRAAHTRPGLHAKGRQDIQQAPFL